MSYTESITNASRAGSADYDFLTDDEPDVLALSATATSTRSASEERQDDPADQDETAATAGDASELAAVIRARRVGRDHDRDFSRMGSTPATDPESPLGAVYLLFLLPLLVATIMAAHAGPGTAGVWSTGTAASAPRIPGAAVVHATTTTTFFATVTATYTLTTVAAHTITSTSTVAMTSEILRTVTTCQDWTTTVRRPITATAYTAPIVTHTVHQVPTTVCEYAVQETLTSTIYPPPMIAYKYQEQAAFTSTIYPMPKTIFTHQARTVTRTIHQQPRTVCKYHARTVTHTIYQPPRTMYKYQARTSTRTIY
ncbi:hypothetical protein GGF32_006342 [Allomyces javanicus]|nr:hypothetical protein GGF32_006342 [Allomyces javanicus]